MPGLGQNAAIFQARFSQKAITKWNGRGKYEIFATHKIVRITLHVKCENSIEPVDIGISEYQLIDYFVCFLLCFIVHQNMQLINHFLENYIMIILKTQFLINFSLFIA